MASQVQIPGTTQTAKIRHPLAVVGLSIVTFGVYMIFWWYFVNREMRDYGQANGTDECGTSPGKSVLAITLGALVIIPALMSYFKGFKRMNAASRISGAGDGFDPGLGLLIWLFVSPIALYIFQMNLNKVWEKSGVPEALGQPAPVAADPVAPTPETPQVAEGGVPPATPGDTPAV